MMRQTLLLLALLLAAPLSLAQPESDLYEQALSAAAEGDDSRASIFLKNALQQNPRHLPSRIFLGQLYLRNGEPAAAAKELRRSLDLRADPNLVLTSLGYSLLLLESFEEIIDFPIPEAVSADTRSQWAMIRGRALLGANRGAEALVVFEGLLRQDPADLDALLGKANAYFARQDYAATREVATRILGLNPDVSSAWKILGDIARLEGNKEEAIEHYSRSIETDPGNFAALKDRAVLLLERGERERALAEIESLREQLPDDPGTILINSWLLAQGKQNREARELLDDLADKLAYVDDSFIARNAKVQLAKGVAYYLQGRTDEALPLLNAFHNRQPQHVGVRLLLAGIARDRNQTDRVLRLLGPIADKLGDNPDLLSAYLRGLVVQGKVDEAIALGTRLHQAAPQDMRLKQLLAGTLAYAGQSERAISVLTDSSESSMTQRGGLMLGYLLLSGDQLPEAVSIAEQLRADYPEDVKVANFAGAVFTRSGDFTRADEALRLALDLDAQNLPVRLNRAYLMLKRGDVADARQAFLDLAEQYPFETEALKALSDIDLKRGELQTAIAWTEKLVELDADNHAYQFRLASLYLRAGREAQTLEYVERLEREYPLDERLVELKARAFLARRELGQAQRWLNFLYGSNIDNADKIIALARLQMEANDAEGARRSVERVRKLRPDALSTQLLSVRFQLGTREIDAALENLERLEREHPENEEVQELLADAFWRKGDLDGFRAHFERVQVLRPSAVRLRLASRRFWQAGQRDLSEQLLRVWAEQHPDDIAIRELHAEVLLGLNRPSEAFRAYQALLDEERVLSAGAFNNLAILALDLEPGAALAFANRAYDMAPEDPAVIDTLAWTLVRQGDAARGLTLLRDAFSRASQNPSVQYHLAAALVELERHEEALRLLKPLVESKVDFPDREAATTMLGTLTANRDGV